MWPLNIQVCGNFANGNGMFHKTGLWLTSNGNTNLHGRQSAAPWQCSQQRVTEQSVAFDSSISYSENGDSARVSQQNSEIIHASGLRELSDQQIENRINQTKTTCLTHQVITSGHPTTLSHKREFTPSPVGGILPIGWQTRVRTMSLIN